MLCFFLFFPPCVLHKEQEYSEIFSPVFCADFLSEMFLETLVLIYWYWNIIPFLTETHLAACVCLVDLGTVFQKQSWRSHTLLNVLALVALSFLFLGLWPVSAAESNPKSLEDSLEVKNVEENSLSAAKPFG